MTTLVLQPDAAAGEDTFIAEAAVNNNYGVSNPMESGTTTFNATRYIGLIKFDISALPAGATLVSSVLSLYCQAEDSATDRDIGAHRSLVEWFEGDANGGAPGGDGSTWNHRNANGAVFWAGGAGNPLSGSDWKAVADDTVTITAAGARYEWDILSMTQDWYDGTETNHGLWLVNTYSGGPNASKKFTTSDGGAANRPKLTIVYTGVGAGGRLLPDHYFHHRRLHR